MKYEVNFRFQTPHPTSREVLECPSKSWMEKPNWLLKSVFISPFSFYWLSFCSCTRDKMSKNRVRLSHVLSIFLFNPMIFLSMFLCLFVSLGRPTVPMSQRNLPASFWIPPSTDQIHQLPTSYHRQGNSMRLFQQNAPNRTTYYSTGCHATNGSQVSLERTAPNVVHTYAIPVSYTQLPMGVVKRFPPGHPQQGSQPSYKASAPPLTQETDIHCNEVQTSFRFNPGYNTLLVQPEVKPHLPVVPGEPSRANSHDEKRNHISPIYPGELMTTPKREEN